MRMIGMWVVGILLLNSPVAAADKPIVAVFDVEKGQRVELDDKALASMVDYIGSRLTESGAYSVVPRDQLKQRLFLEQKKSYKECYDRSCQMEVGRALAAEKTLATKVARLGEGCVVSLTLYDLRKTATEKAATRRGGCGEGEVVASLEAALGKLLAAGPAPKPAEKALVSAPPPELDWVVSKAVGLEFSRAEITFAQYRACVAAGACEAPHLADNTCAVWTGGQWEKGPLPKRFLGEDQPVVCVDWHQAESFCDWVGGRLPGEGEWETEASAVGKRTYAWGKEKATSRNYGNPSFRSSDAGIRCVREPGGKLDTNKADF